MDINQHLDSLADCEGGGGKGSLVHGPTLGMQQLTCNLTMMDNTSDSIKRGSKTVKCKLGPFGPDGHQSFHQPSVQKSQDTFSDGLLQSKRSEIC